MPTLKINLKRRWIKARPGSVLILVIALLVLLALIGTAYLSSTQTEKFSSHQNSVNVQADLLVQGLIDAINSAIVTPLFASTGTGTQYRPPAQEMPTYKAFAPTYPVATGYHNYDSVQSDVFLGSRHPLNYAPANATPIPYWDSISFPLFPDSSGSYSFDSPFENSTVIGLPANKASVQAIPTYKTVNGQVYPGMLYYVPGGQTLQYGSGITTYTAPPGGGYITPNGVLNGSSLPAIGTPAYNTYVNFAASASGDGISDSGLSKLPVGQLNNITYYYGLRIIDNNSAINASSAWTANGDPNSPTTTLPNYGFFPSGVGLQELLVPATTPTPSQEMAALNNYRFGGTFISPTAAGTAQPGIFGYPVPSPDMLNPQPPTNWQYYSMGDALHTQLTRRPGNPGLGGVSSSTKFNWLGLNASASLAYRFSLIDPNSSQSVIEQLLPNELRNNANIRSTPYSPSETAPWYSALFPTSTNYPDPTGVGGIVPAGTSLLPLRTMLVCDNAVSNAVPSRLGTGGSSTPMTWTAGVQYNFGDWVLDGPVGYQRSFVCLRPHLSSSGTEPEPGATASNPIQYNRAAEGIWAGAQSKAGDSGNRPPGMPWLTQPVKASINTASFDELYLAFAQVMTDSVGPDTNTTLPGPTPHWQPPMVPQLTNLTNPNGEQQLPQFRSVIRDTKASGTLGRVQLSPAQMLRLRAALAAVNTIDLRDRDNDVTSRHIVLDDSSGTPQYEVEVFGTERQPYISKVMLQTSGKPGETYIAIEICNPYDKPITLTNWQLGFVDRSAFPNLAITGLAIPPIPVQQIPAASNNVPGMLILYDGTVPPDIQTKITQNQAAYPLDGIACGPWLG